MPLEGLTVEDGEHNGDNNRGASATAPGQLPVARAVYRFGTVRPRAAARLLTYPPPTGGAMLLRGLPHPPFTSQDGPDDRSRHVSLGIR